MTLYTLKIKTKLPFEEIQKRLLLQPNTFEGKATGTGWCIVVKNKKGLDSIVYHLSKLLNETMIRNIAFKTMYEAGYTDITMESYLENGNIFNEDSTPWQSLIMNDLTELLNGAIEHNKTVNLDSYCMFSANEIKEDMKKYIRFLDELIIETVVDTTVQPFFENSLSLDHLDLDKVLIVEDSKLGPILTSNQSGIALEVHSFDQSLFPSGKQNIFSKDAARISLIQLYSLLIILSHFFQIEEYVVEKEMQQAITFFMEKYKLNTHVVVK